MRAGDHHVGVRTDDSALLLSLRTLYEPHLVDDDAATDDFDISLHGVDTDPHRALPTLSHGRQARLRSRAVDRLLRYVDVRLGVLARRGEPTPGLELAGMAAIVGDGRAVLLPQSAADRSTGVERAIARRGAGVAEAVGTRLDPRRGDVIVLPGLARDHDREPLAGPLAVPPGRYELTGVHWFGTDHAEHERPAAALVRLHHRITDFGSHEPGEVLHQLAALRDRFSPFPIEQTGVSDIDHVLEEL